MARVTNAAEPDSSSLFVTSPCVAREAHRCMETITAGTRRSISVALPPCPDAEEFEAAGVEELLRWSTERFGRKLILVTSFQAEGMALLDMAWRIDPTIRILTIDTGRLPDETYALIDTVRERYGVSIEVVLPDTRELEAFVRSEGVNAFYRDVELRRQCCAIRKVAPLKRALAGAEAWISGQRREHAASRRSIGKVEHDESHGGIVKLNPLADWTTSQVWEYLAAHDVPHNTLYDRGYTSIGCAPCTRATAAGEDPRAGRWWWELDEAKECGIHLPASSQFGLSPLHIIGETTR
jgi:thioredoxin-dependent adenylylsulfate APS reductase